MDIHVVEQGETIDSIAEHYGVTPTRLMRDNGISITRELVQGEALVILYPEQTYIVKDGDSLTLIAQKYNTSVKQLVRNNPFLEEREYIYPGEELIISYGNKIGKITTNGYANSFINGDTLQGTLPYLTYLSVFGNRNFAGGEIITVQDSDIVATSRDNGVIPIMMLSTMSEQGRGSLEISYSIVTDEEVLENNINNILENLRRKGYFGVNITFQFINAENSKSYEKYIRKITDRLKQEGYLVFITISETFIIVADKVSFEKIDYGNIGKIVDGVTFLNYNWGSSYGPPGPVLSVFLMKEFLQYVTTMIPPEKLEIGVPIIGYDWEFPYVIGVTKANSLTLDSAIRLAGDVGAVIMFDEVSQTPFFRYVEIRGSVPIRHIVWFVDARSINAVLAMITDLGFRGVGIWNIMNYYTQLWSIINSQYEIETLLT